MLQGQFSSSLQNPEMNLCFFMFFPKWWSGLSIIYRIHITRSEVKPLCFVLKTLFNAWSKLMKIFFILASHQIAGFEHNKDIVWDIPLHTWYKYALCIYEELCCMVTFWCYYGGRAFYLWWVRFWPEIKLLSFISWLSLCFTVFFL